MTLIDTIVPNLSQYKKEHIKTSSNSEYWFKIVNGYLYIPAENYLRGNFRLLDTLIETLHNYEISEPIQGWWKDELVHGRTFGDVDECIGAINFLSQCPVLACDIETRNTEYDGNKILLIGFAYNDYDSIVIANLNQVTILDHLRALFARKDITFIWQNGKFDTARLKYLCNVDARVDEDTMLQHYVGINEYKGTHGLKDLGALYLQAPKWDEKLDVYKRRWCLQNKVKMAEFQYDMIPPEILIPYLYRDTCATFQLHKRFKELMRPGTEFIYRQLIKASNVFRDIEVAGCLVDRDYLYELQDKLDTLILESEKHVKEEAARTWNPQQYMKDYNVVAYPGNFNLKSPKQLKWMLETVTGEKLNSTNKETLDNLLEKYPDIPFIKAITDLRKYNKYMDTYVQGIQEVMGNDARVHCTFNLHGTETGRLSCSSPNMQNVPRLKLIKNLFIAPPGYKLVQFDFSQAELRVLAWLSQDEYLRETYREGMDLHDAMALKIFGPDFTKEQRVAAKTVYA